MSKARLLPVERRMHWVERKTFKDCLVVVNADCTCFRDKKANSGTSDVDDERPQLSAIILYTTDLSKS